MSKHEHEPMIREIVESNGGWKKVLESFRVVGITRETALRNWMDRGVPVKHVPRLCSLSMDYAPEDFYPEFFEI